jgi:hypothetical protein
MKLSQPKFSPVTMLPSRRHEQGILLIDCMVYLALFFIISGVAFVVFYSCWDNSKNFRRSTDEIAATLKIGDRWRADVRTATAPLRVEASPTDSLLRIPQKTGEIDYRFFEGSLWRRNGTDAEWIELLPKIKSSRMAPDQRHQVTAWRWEVELMTHRKGARVVPLFTFEAVPQHLD